MDAFSPASSLSSSNPISSSNPMRRRFCAALAAAALLAPGLVAAPASADEPSAYDFAFESIEGGPLALSDYRGQALLVVNTASRCGFTPQYEGLQALWERYREEGLVVIGAPSGDFKQELGDASAVKEFCETTFSIDFPMTEIVPVKGAEAHPFFAWAAERSEAPRWNFNKYLIGRDGALIAHFPQSVTPDALAPEIEKALGAES